MAKRVASRFSKPAILLALVSALLVFGVTQTALARISSESTTPYANYPDTTGGSAWFSGGIWHTGDCINLPYTERLHASTGTDLWSKSGTDNSVCGDEIWSGPKVGCSGYSVRNYVYINDNTTGKSDMSSYASC
jgi:hypothetical protein